MSSSRGPLPQQFTNLREQRFRGAHSLDLPTGWMRRVRRVPFSTQWTGGSWRPGRSGQPAGSSPRQLVVSKIPRAAWARGTGLPLGGAAGRLGAGTAAGALGSGLVGTAALEDQLHDKRGVQDIKTECRTQTRASKPENLKTWGSSVRFDTQCRHIKEKGEMEGLQNSIQKQASDLRLRTSGTECQLKLLKYFAETYEANPRTL